MHTDMVRRERSQTLNRLIVLEKLADKLVWRRKAAADQAHGARELARRQKTRMIEGKKHGAKIKSKRARLKSD